MTATVSSSAAGGGEGGSGPVACNSNPDCPEPTSVCDTVSNTCVECLVLADCAFRPGTVCSEGSCVCPNKESYCGEGECVDLTTSSDHCGQCGHACFGLCTAGNCVDPWEPVALKDAPAPRTNHVAVWTGSKMVVWGGRATGSSSSALASGGLYDPATYTWTPTSSVGAPSARFDATVVWTGTEMIVWGGTDSQGAFLNDGGRFDPAKNTWNAMSTAGAPTARTNHTAVWSGTEMLVWGGDSAVGQLSTGGRYSPITNTWLLMNMTGLNPLTQRTRHCAVWDKSKSLMNIVNGFGTNQTEGLNDVYFPASQARALIQYAPVGENWYNFGQSFEPSPRESATCVYDGTRTIVFGGYDGSSYLNTGSTWDPTTGWTPISGAAPDPRRRHTATWLDSKKIMVVFGGQNPGTLDSGAIYDGASNSWTTALPKAVSARHSHTAVSTGDKLIVWGGTGNSGTLADGGIYKP